MSSIFDIPTDFIRRQSREIETLPDYRTQFMRDRDRVMYCTAFRRLSGKTQIYTIGSDDHKKNRLTHSLEVSQIARTIAAALGLNCDLAEAIALAHDFGHTPFGHAGEMMLHEIMIPDSKYVRKSPLYGNKKETIIDTIDRETNNIKARLEEKNVFGFKHNLQSVRVACILEDNYRDAQGNNIGLNLTNYTLWGMMHHSSLVYKDNGFPPDYQTVFQPLLQAGTKPSVEAWSFEAYIVKIADDIAQWHHDLEDAIRGDAIPIQDICERIQEGLELTNEDDLSCIDKIGKAGRVDRRNIATLSHIVINTLVNDIVNNSRDNLECIEKAVKGYADKHGIYNNDEMERLLYRDYKLLEDELTKEKETLTMETAIAFSPKIKREVFEKTIKAGVHHSRDVERMNEKGKYIIRKLFEAYYSHPQQLPDGPIFHFMVDIKEYKNIDKAREAGAGQVRTRFDELMKNPTLMMRLILMRRICDHIACMTDRYAIEEYNNLYG